MPARNIRHDEEGRITHFDCVCGARIERYSSWANECDRCGREYNGSGQLLAPREQWGEETGEDWRDLSNFNPDQY